MRSRRDHDEERAAVVDRLRQHPERRRFRSDVELRKQRAELERQWNEQHRRRKRKAS